MVIRLKPLPPNTRSLGAYTLLEIISIVAVILSLTLVLTFKFSNASAKGKRIKCVSRLKNVGLSFRIWFTDNGHQFPFQMKTNGTAQFTNASDAFRHFQILSNELNIPVIMQCRADREKKVAPDFQRFSNANVSYFVNLTARETYPQTMLAGDRNILLDQTPLSPGKYLLSSNANVSWSKQMHKLQGQAAMGDGSVNQMKNNRLRDTIRSSETATNLILFP
jgi:hypothetical protein